MRTIFYLIFLMLPASLFAQNTAVINGKVIDDEDEVLKNVTVTILGRQKGITVSDSGNFSLVVPANRRIALVFKHPNFRDAQRNFYLNPGENEYVVVKMFQSAQDLAEVVIKDNRDRQEAGLARLNPKLASNLPGSVSGVEGLIKTIVGSNNELSSQYSVRGGNYDENLVYINDFEIYRPYLVSSGQQEGLSMINPDMVKSINFYSGGFAAKYGDKISSVLDIQYKQPTKFGGTGYIGFLEQGLQLEGVAAKKSFSYMMGLRNKSNSNLLQSQQTKGAYMPAANDFQASFGYKVNDQLSLELLAIYSSSKFSFYPEEAKKTTGVFSPLYSSALGLDIYFDGLEKDRFVTSLTGLGINQKVNKKLNLKWLVSNFRDVENERVNIGASYLFGEREFDPNTGTLGNIANPLGSGYYLNYARNKLNITEWSVGNRGTYKTEKHFISWGLNLTKTKVEDRMNQFEYQDSAGYSIPLHSNQLFNAVFSQNSIDVAKVTGFLQDNVYFLTKKARITLQGGVRFHSNNLNKETLLSPRFSASIAPMWKRDVIFKLAAGIYHQPPFYREMRLPNGQLNKEVKAQKSYQFSGGFDYSFLAWGKSPFRLNVEAYYKKLWDVNVYDVENVQIRYLANNNAKAYTTGIDLRLAGEIVEGAESWLSFGLMRSREDLDNDTYYKYYNASGEEINATTTDKMVADSAQFNMGWVRRPSDRLMTLGLFLEDYLSTNKNFKVHVNMLYGSNMPYNVGGNVRFRNAMEIPSYFRADLGFSVLLLNEKSQRRSHSPFKDFENVWLTAEIFNLFNRANTISYQMIKDYSNTIFAIPNTLTPRLINAKLIARF